MAKLWIPIKLKENAWIFKSGLSWVKYRVYQNDWSDFEVDYIHKYGEQNYKY